MKSKHLFQIFVLLMLLFSPFGNSQPVHASTASVDVRDAVMVDRNLEYWDSDYIGYVNFSIHENWRLGLSEAHNFIVTVSPITGDLIPLLILLDADGNELTRGIGTLTSAQPAGDYSIQVQPQTGNGFYFLLLRDIIQTQPITSTVLDPSSLTVGNSAVAAVSLNNVPVQGYTSAEFTCSYDPALAEVSNITVHNRFGPDPVVAINGPHPQGNSFIVAIAGSHGDKVTTSGVVFSFDVKGLQTGHTTIECAARVSKGDNLLADLPSIGTRLTLLEGMSTPTLTGTPPPTPTPSITPGGPTLTPSPTATPTVRPVACDRAEFVADVNVPPGTVMSPGVGFTKTWRLKNVGACTWTTSYRMAFFSGEQMRAPSSVQFPVNVPPGVTVNISLNLITPSTTGSYRGYWMFQNDTGALFGIGPQANEPWFVDIVVAEETATPTTVPGDATISPTPSSTPGGPTSTPGPGVAYDFAANACAATWFSGAGQLPCPGIDGNANGFVLKLDNPKLETGATDTRPGLLTFPQNVQNGYIQGFYPPFHVESGDRFRSTLGCEFGATTCYAAFRLDYQIGSDSIRTFWGPFLERYEGRYYLVDIDLSALAGKDVKFILTVLSAGAATGDRALWGNPILFRPPGTATPPVPSETLTPDASSTATPVPDAGMLVGQVRAGKPVTLSLYRGNAILVTSATANPDGAFSFTVPVGTYLVFARADGFLGAEGSVTVLAGGTSTMPVISLPAGDIDGNSRIDQFDVLTIGINYNNALPSVADLNDDGIINVMDLELLARDYRKAGLVPWDDYR